MGWVFTSHQPIYLQIMTEIKIRIIRGQYPSGERLPSVRELAVEAGVNPNTMQKALAGLEEEGLLYSVRTSGRFVTTEQEVLERLRVNCSQNVLQLFFEEMHALGFSDEDIIAKTMTYGGRAQ